jgi:hypothetical protein
LVTQINPLSSLAYHNGQPVVQPEDGTSRLAYREW